MAVSYGESILIKMTPEDIKAIEAKMEQAGVKNRSAYIRKMARDGYIIMLDLSDLKEVLRLLRINSNNLNQYAKKANECGEVYREDMKVLQSQLDEIWEAVRGILERLANIS
ncbi:plasmid mobilization relaxosome protein MobC [Butyrivibrio sp. CB08]|uniref:plasmid mobilization protein n=1 Tax=Butyrivibrio sp. CB08 TaxID=2364879 RepID=UPI000EA86168|nr:plasmid mobilization relaxosome protein MobC [Butyrivibrio sp. CB08]RKM56856.1 plasmid mobilization relaxosome protein MobC [Butyrivibrio sp. CB08]